jgi:cytochrome c
MEWDVTRGREHMNLSDWSGLSEDRQQTLGAAITQQTRHGGMPPLQYRLLHWSAALTDADLRALALLNLTGVAEASEPREGDPSHGKAVFERKCTGCHSLDSDHEGPRLRGVYGRKAGSVSGFQYSVAMKKSGTVWTEVNLERWVRDSDAMLPGTEMGFSVPKVQDRADLIAFLKTLS